jgi:hypothetical protein
MKLSRGSDVKIFVLTGSQSLVLDGHKADYLLVLGVRSADIRTQELEDDCT